MKRNFKIIYINNTLIKNRRKHKRSTMEYSRKPSAKPTLHSGLIRLVVDSRLNRVRSHIELGKQPRSETSGSICARKRSQSGHFIIVLARELSQCTS